MRDDVLVDLVRGELLESQHRGSLIILDAHGEASVSLGEVASPMFPRSSNKPMQAVGLVEAGLDIEPELLALAAASLFWINRNPDWDVQPLYFFGSFALGFAAGWLGSTTASSGTRIAGLAIFVLAMVALVLDWRLRIAVALVCALSLSAWLPPLTAATPSPAPTSSTSPRKTARYSAVMCRSSLAAFDFLRVSPPGRKHPRPRSPMRQASCAAIAAATMMHGSFMRSIYAIAPPPSTRSGRDGA